MTPSDVSRKYSKGLSVLVVFLKKKTGIFHEGNDDHLRTINLGGGWWWTEDVCFKIWLTGGSLTQILWYQMMLLESHLGKILQNSPNGRVWGFWILTAVSNINREGSKIPVNICWCRCVYEFILGLFRFSQLLRCFRFLCMYLVLVSVFLTLWGEQEATRKLRIRRKLPALWLHCSILVDHEKTERLKIQGAKREEATWDWFVWHLPEGELNVGSTKRGKNHSADSCGLM